MSSQCEPCKRSERERLATCKCEDCGEVYCEKCLQDHGKFRAFTNHNVVKLEQQGAKASNFTNVSLDTDLNQLTLGDSTSRQGALCSGSDDLDADVGVNAGSIALGTDECVYAGSDAFGPDEGVNAGSDAFETDKGINAGSEALGTDKDVTNADDHLPVNRFTIDVDDTPLARAIGIQHQRCLLIVSGVTKSITIANSDVKKVNTSFKCLRRYGHIPDKKDFCFEFGRGFMCGEGSLYFDIKDRTVRELYLCVRETTGKGAVNALGTDIDVTNAGSGHPFENVDDDHLSINLFTIDVDDTPLARGIGIQHKRCILIVSITAFSISIYQNGERKFYSSFECVKKYGYKMVTRRFMFEFGRRSLYGEGILLFDIKDRPVGELSQRVKDAEEVHGGRLYST